MGTVILETMGWAAFVFTIAGIYLMGEKKISCWPILIFAGIIWLVYGVMLKQAAFSLMEIVLIGFNVNGWMKWKKAGQPPVKNC